MIITNIGDDVEKLEHSYVTDGNVKYYSHCGKQFGAASKS